MGKEKKDWCPNGHFIEKGQKVPKWVATLRRLADEVNLSYVHIKTRPTNNFVLVWRGSGNHQSSSCSSGWCRNVCCRPQEANRWKYYGSCFYNKVIKCFLRSDCLIAKCCLSSGSPCAKVVEITTFVRFMTRLASRI